MRPMNVKVGISSIVGYVLTGVGIVATAVVAAEHEWQQGKWVAILTAITAISTNLGRMLQAATASPPVEVLTEKPETAVKADSTPPASV